jgi:hypothetical protein
VPRRFRSNATAGTRFRLRLCIAQTAPKTIPLDGEVGAGDVLGVGSGSQGDDCVEVAVTAQAVHVRPTPVPSYSYFSSESLQQTPHV